MVKRKSAKLKAQIVLELLRGKLIEEVSREYQVTVADLLEWRDAFIKNGKASFKKHTRDSQIANYERTLGRLHMENELLKKKEKFPISARGNSLK